MFSRYAQLLLDKPFLFEPGKYHGSFVQQKTSTVSYVAPYYNMSDIFGPMSWFLSLVKP